MSTNTADSALGGERRSRAERLTVNLPAGTLTALKIHVARRETTIREVVTALVLKTVETDQIGKNYTHA